MATQQNRLLRLLAVMLLASLMLGCVASGTANRADNLYLLVEQREGVYQVGGQRIAAGDAAALGAALSAYPTKKVLLKDVRLGDLLQLMPVLSAGDYQVFYIGGDGAINRATFIDPPAG